MSISIEKLLNDAIKLSNNLKDCETESDSLIFKTVNLNKDSENIKEYCEDMNILSKASVNQPRKSLITSIQIESKKLKELEAENVELKALLQDYELVMKVMNLKYRNHISKLISHMQVNKKTEDNIFEKNCIQKIAEQDKKIDELNAFIHKIINLDVENFLNIQKSLTQLELENEGLRHILKISKDYDSSMIKPIDVSVQTDDLCDLKTYNDNLSCSLAEEALEISLKDEDLSKNCSTIRKVIKEDNLKTKEQS